MGKMNSFLEKKFVKVFCVYINPIIIGLLLPITVELYPNKGAKFYIVLAITVILLLSYVYTSYMYLKNEKKDQENQKDLVDKITTLEVRNSLLEKEKEAFNKGMRELATLFYDSSSSLNEISYLILNGNRSLDVWNFKKVATGVCSSVYNLLCEVCKPCDDFTVNIMLADSTATRSKKNITMIAHKGKYEKYPGKFETKLYFEKNDTFYAVKVFKSSNTDIRILTTKEEVNEKFVYVDEEHPEYNQYVGIPIICSGNKIVCLLQICAFGNDKIAETKSEILKIVKEYIFPFTHYALLSYKVEKSLVSSFSAFEKNEGGKQR